MLRALVSTGGTTDLVSFDATCFKIEIGVKRLIFKSFFSAYSSPSKRMMCHWDPSSLVYSSCQEPQFRLKALLKQNWLVPPN